LKILYVEDESEAREALTKYLKRRFGKIFTAVDGLDGLKVFREEMPDLVIVDLYMPNMDGLEMIREIKKISPDVFVIVTTAVDDAEVIIKSVDAGICKYLLKPIDPKALTDAVSEYSMMAAQRQKAREIFDTENKKQLEDRIKKEFTSFLKAKTGKGPSGVSAFIDRDKIEIKAFDAFTVMEKSMIDNSQNSIIIEQYRMLFYSVSEKAICDLIHGIIGSRVKFLHVEISVENRTNKIELQILR